MFFKSNKCAYILGAGFSKTFGLPLANEFIPHLIKDCSNDFFIYRINEVCNMFYPRFRAVYGNYPNIEDFLNYYHSLMNYFSLVSEGPNKYMSELYPKNFILEISRFLRKKVNQIPPSSEKYIQYFFKCLNPGDVIITFNWDNLIEKYFEKYEVEYTYNFHPDNQAITLIKLHGSIDWVLTDDELNNDLFMAISEDEPKIYRCKNDDFIELFENEGIEPFLIPPLTYKDEFLKPLRSIWISAYNVLRGYNNKFFIGYSLPKEDMMARILFSSYHCFAAMDEDDSLVYENIIVLNPDEQIDNHFRRFYCNRNIEFRYTTLDQLIDGIVSSNELKVKLLPYKEFLLRNSDAYVRSIAVEIFEDNVKYISSFEKYRIKDFLKQIHNIELDL